MELLFFHDTAQPEVGNHDVRILRSSSEEQVFGLEITMNDTAVVDILDGLHDSAYQLGSIAGSFSRRLQDKRAIYARLMVVTLGAYPVKELSTTAQVEDQIQVVGCLDLSVRNTFKELNVDDPLQNNRRV
jgi:hypothetical protein